MYRFTKILKIFQNSVFVVKVSRNSYYVGGLFPRWEYVRCIDDSFSQRAGSLKKFQNQDVKIKFPLPIRDFACADYRHSHFFFKPLYSQGVQGSLVNSYSGIEEDRSIRDCGGFRIFLFGPGDCSVSRVKFDYVQIYKNSQNISKL